MYSLWSTNMVNPWFWDRSSESEWLAALPSFGDADFVIRSSSASDDCPPWRRGRGGVKNEFCDSVSESFASNLGILVLSPSTPKTGRLLDLCFEIADCGDVRFCGDGDILGTSRGGLRTRSLLFASCVSKCVAYTVSSEKTFRGAICTLTGLPWREIVSDWSVGEWANEFVFALLGDAWRRDGVNFTFDGECEHVFTADDRNFLVRETGQLGGSIFEHLSFFGESGILESMSIDSVSRVFRSVWMLEKDRSRKSLPFKRGIRSHEWGRLDKGVAVDDADADAGGECSVCTSVVVYLPTSTRVSILMLQHGMDFTCMHR